MALLTSYFAGSDESRWRSYVPQTVHVPQRAHKQPERRQVHPAPGVGRVAGARATCDGAACGSVCPAIVSSDQSV
eukprot:gene24095-biopygen23877